MSQARSGSWGFPLLSAVLVLLAASGALAVERPAAAAPAAGIAVAWPPSPDLVIGEVVTGGAGASDEYVEIYNRGSLTVDLGGLELVYATATGSTVTRKATWTSRLLDPGRHELVANGSGAFAGLADDVYSGGLAATGGAVALRVVGGAVLDSIGWGTASSGFRGRERGAGAARRPEPRTAARWRGRQRPGHERQPGGHLDPGLSHSRGQQLAARSGAERLSITDRNHLADSSPDVSQTPAGRLRRTNVDLDPTPTPVATPTPTPTPTARPRARPPPDPDPGPDAHPDAEPDPEPDP